VRDARRAKLWNNLKKLPWTEYVKDMLLWRARSRAMAIGFSDCLLGLPLRELIPDMIIEADEPKDVTQDDGEFAEQMAQAMMGGAFKGVIRRKPCQPQMNNHWRSPCPTANRRSRS
jgi:hypothetical protein